MKLSKRLLAVASFLRLPDNIADIGTDHAYLPVYLAKKSKQTKVIAIENKEQPYNMATRTVKKYNLSTRIELRLGSGLQPLKFDEVNTVVIAGMGAGTIREIIKADYSLAQNLDSLVLQPMAGVGKLRKWLAEHNFKIQAEKLVKEGEIYQVLHVLPGKMEVKDEFLLEIGPEISGNITNPLVREYLLELKNKWQRIIKKIAEAKNDDHPRILELQSKIEKLEEILERRK